MKRIELDGFLRQIAAGLVEERRSGVVDRFDRLRMKEMS